MRQLALELQTHQVELVLQNEELRRTQTALEAERARYFELYDLAPAGYITLDTKGLIRAANLTAATLLGVARTQLLKRPLAQYIHPEDQESYYRYRQKLGVTPAAAAAGAPPAGGDRPQTCEVRLLPAQAAPFWADLEATTAHDLAGALECRIVLSDITGRKQTEARLRESEANLLAFFDSPGLMRGMVELVPGDILHILDNAASARFFGRSVADLRHQLASHLGVPAETIRLWRQHYAESARTGQPVDFEYSHGTDDHLRHFHVTVSHLGQGLRGSRHAYVIADATVQRQAEAALRAEHKRLEAVLEGTQAGTWEWNIQTGATVFDERWAQMLGYTLAELGPLSIKTWEALVHPEDLQRSLALLQRHFAGELAYYDCECRLRHKSGQWVWMHDRGCVGTRTADGQPLLMYGTHTDITERKQTEATLRESESALREAQSIADQGSYVLDIPAGYWTSSAQLDKIFGINAAYVRSVTGWTDLIHPDDRTLMADYFRHAVLVQHKTFDKAYRIIRHNDHSVGWVHGLGRLEYDAQGRLLIMRGTIQDITARKRVEAEQALLEARTWQLQKAESLGRMAGAIAHHFNNQLQVVAGNLELVGVPKDARTAECLGEAMLATRQAIKISRLMLTYLGRTTDAHTPLDLAELCRQSLPLLQSATHVVMQTDLAEPGPVIRANAPQLQQMLTNLVTNAAESGGFSRGAIRLFVKTVSAPDIPAAHRFPLDWQPQVQDYVCLGVADAGCGITPEHLTQIFDPFFSSKFQGRGLGLAVVLGLVKAHSGCITVESEPGQGSTFQLFFPALSPTALHPPQPRPSPAFTAGGTVLLVDDEERVRTMAAAMLVRLGFTVLTAAGGSEAVEVFRQQQAGIRCVLTDLSMPGLDGWATLTALRALRADLPVVLSSGYEETNVLSDTCTERPQAFLAKPYTLQALREALGLALDNSGPTVAQAQTDEAETAERTGRPSPPESAP